MAEKINLFELNIDVDAAIKSTAQMRDNADQLKIKYDALRKSSSASTEEVVRARGEYDNANKQYRSAQTEVTKLTQLKGKEIKTVEEGRVALSVLNKEWAKQASLYGENSKEAENLAKKTKQTRERLKELESGVGDNTRNVGNYTESFKGAIQQSGLFGQAQGVVNNVTSAGGPLMLFLSTSIKKVKTDYAAASVNTAGFTKAQIAAHVASTGLSAGLKLLRLALIATGIGAIIVLVGSLVAWFSKTQAGIDAVNKVLAVLGAAFDVIIDRATALIGALGKMFSGDVLGGFADLKSSMSGIGDEMEREIKLTKELQDAKNQLRRDELGLIQTQSERRKEVENLRFAAKDELKDLAERAALLEKAGKVEEQILADQLRIAKEKARISQEDTDRAVSTDEELKANEELQAAVIDLETESLKKRRSIETEKQSLLKRGRAEEAAAQKEAETAAATAQKEAIANAKAATDAAISESKTRLAIYLEENKGKADSLKGSIKFEEEARDRRLKILEEEIAAGKKTQSEAELERLKIKNEFLDQQTAAVQKFAAQEFELFKDANQARLEAGQLLTDELVAQETARLEAVAEAERQYQAKRLEAGIINQQEYNAAIQTVNDTALNEQEEIKAERDAQQREKEAIDFENRMATQSENFLSTLEAEQEQLERKRQAEVANAEKTGADISLINEKYGQQQNQIEQEKADFKQEAAAQTFGNLAELLGKESAAGKAAALVQIAIDTQKAAIAAYSSLAGIPIVGPAAGAVAAAAAIAAGIKAAGKVTGLSAPKIPKAAKGITLEGRSHSAGGETLYNSSGDPLVEAEGGENVYVLNKKASGLINTLSNINQLTGGASLSKATRYAAAGGMIKKSVTGAGSGINYDQLAETMSQAFASAPAPRLALDEFKSADGKYTEVKEGAIF